MNTTQSITRQKLWLSILGGIFIVSFLLRWYRLPENLFFGFEQGRDAMVIDSISQLKDFVLVGPKTDIAGVFHGAWYYYLMVLPFVLGSGNPLAGAAFLTMLSSLVPLVMFSLMTDVTGRKKWGLVAAVLSTFSFELVTYSRWLSNVSPAVLCMAVTLWATWKYQRTKQERFIILSTLMAVLAAQFEIILLLWFVFFYAVLLITSQMQLPHLKSILAIALGAAILFAPMLLFNLRNEFITVTSAVAYVSSSGEEHVSPAFTSTLLAYAGMMLRLLRKTIFHLPNWAMGLGSLLVVYGVIRTKVGTPQRSAVWLFMTWTCMSLPVLLFSESLGLKQLYVGTGLGLIGLAVIALQRFVQLKWGYFAISALALLLVANAINTVHLVNTNQDFFFITIQDDLRYEDQRALLEWVNQDAEGQPYRLKAFSIPYYQEEGWQYLHSYLYSQVTEIGATHIYVVIERPVDPYWIEQWTTDLGPTTQVEEKEFGLLRVRKLRIEDQI